MSEALKVDIETAKMSTGQLKTRICAQLGLDDHEIARLTGRGVEREFLMIVCQRIKDLHAGTGPKGDQLEKAS